LSFTEFGAGARTYHIACSGVRQRNFDFLNSLDQFNLFACEQTAAFDANLKLRNDILVVLSNGQCADFCKIINLKKLVV
jgi:hypothetical protein